jgi:hypothetical protein
VTTLFSFIRDDVLAPRLERHAVLTVYDPKGRYGDVCRSLASEATTVIDVGQGSIESREQAIALLGTMGAKAHSDQRLLIYIPTKSPVTDHELMADPFSVYTTFGAKFPNGDGDEFQSLCLRANPDHATGIREIFARDPNPDFAVIDAVGAGVDWPMLRAALKVQSPREILFALLAPKPAQSEALKANDGWSTEARSLLERALGLKLMTKGKTWSSINGELWRFLLFSEFAFDLPGDLPPSLAGVPRAPESARPLVEDLCEQLRSDPRARVDYMVQADKVEADLNLPSCCAGLVDLGVRDTFAFEERTFLAQAVKAVSDDRIDDVRALLEHHRGSVWVEKGESQAKWQLLSAAIQLVDACSDADRELGSHLRSLEVLIEHYAATLREADRHQREFEQAVSDYVPTDDAMSPVIEQARRRYGKLVEKMQTAFSKLFETAGWPVNGRLAASAIFNRVVAPMLTESGRKVAYVMVDALRYELGVALQRQLGETEQVEIQAACAQLPTVTPVGMASLLPGAEGILRVVQNGDGFAVRLGEVPISSVADRLAVFRTRYGDRFGEATVDAFIRGQSVPSPSVELFVLRSSEIDSHLESNPGTTLNLIHQSLKALRSAVHKLKGLGFSDVVIATDHGFALNAHAEAGDVCAKPPGKWLMVHDRSLLGEGAGDLHNMSISAEKAGILGDFATFAGPRAMAPYRKGVLYFHGGASLQEAVIPVITVRLRSGKQAEVARAKVTFSYKNGAKRITTRFPVVEVSVEGDDIFSVGTEFEILLEAHDKKGNVVGEAKRGGLVDVASGTVKLVAGSKLPMTVRMVDEFEGKFTLKALNPVTLALYASLELETDYAV